jgi:hypothetical protein
MAKVQRAFVHIMYFMTLGNGLNRESTYVGLVSPQVSYLPATKTKF